MKKMIFLYILVLPLSLCAQNDFEGIITYRGTSTANMKPFEIKMSFSDKKMKVEIIGDDLSDPEINKWEIFNYKTGIHYTIWKEEKIFSTDSLDNFSNDDNQTTLRDTSLQENILGNSCQAFVAAPSRELLRLLWLADSIRFIIPEKYCHKRGIETLHDGNMLFLKMQAIINLGFDDDEEDDIIKNKLDTFFLTAQKIERVKLNESQFLPPTGYSFSTHERSIPRDSVRVRELTLTELKQEEVIKPEPPPPPPPKETKPLKSPAKKTKQTKPVKG